MKVTFNYDVFSNSIKKNLYLKNLKRQKKLCSLVNLDNLLTINNIPKEIFRDLYSSRSGVADYLKSKNKNLKIKVLPSENMDYIKVALLKKSKQVDCCAININRTTSATEVNDGFLRTYYKTVEDLVNYFLKKEH